MLTNDAAETLVLKPYCSADYPDSTLIMGLRKSTRDKTYEEVLEIRNGGKERKEKTWKAGKTMSRVKSQTIFVRSEKQF